MDLRGCKNAYDHITDKLMASEQPLWILSHIPIYSLNGAKFKATFMLDALNESKLHKHLPQIAMTIAAHRHEALLVNPNMGNPATKGPIQYATGHAGVMLSGDSEDQLACDLAKVKWKPIGQNDDEKDSKARWLVLRRPNHGYLKADFRGGQARFWMNFYSVAQNQWYRDATVNCNGDASGRFACPYLPTSADAKCP